MYVVHTTVFHIRTKQFTIQDSSMRIDRIRRKKKSKLKQVDHSIEVYKGVRAKLWVYSSTNIKTWKNDTK